MPNVRKSRRLADLPLAAKLFVAPAVVVGCLLLVAFTAYRGVAKQKQAIENMHTKRFAMYRAGTDLLLELTRAHEGMFRVMTWSQVGYSEDRIESVVSEQTKRLDAVKETVAEVLARAYLLPEERTAFAGLDKPLADYRMWSQRVMEMANSDIATAAVYMGTAELKYKILNEVLTKLKDLEIQASDRYFAESMSAYQRTMLILILGICSAISIAIVVTYLVTRIIIRPVKHAVAELGAITEGQWDLTRRIPLESTDEISLMMVGINHFIEKLQSLIHKISQSTGTLSVSSRELTEISESLSTNTQETSQSTSRAALTTQNASRNIGNISDAAEAMSAGVRSVAVSIEQMSEHLQNVVKHCKDETTMATTANDQAVTTRDLMIRLGQSSREIGKIVDLIKTIAEQTNLLALNANIEAASAGAAGKGFAVVAREVKDLALKTSQATNQIGSQIEKIQDDTKAATAAIETITSIISEINAISRTIVASIEDVSQTTTSIASSTAQSSSAASRIANNVAESARGLSEVNGDVQRVSQSAERTAGEANRITSSSRGLAELSGDLGKIVAQFKV